MQQFRIKYALEFQARSSEELFVNAKLLEYLSVRVPPRAKVAPARWRAVSFS